MTFEEWWNEHADDPSYKDYLTRKGVAHVAWNAACAEKDKEIEGLNVRYEAMRKRIAELEAELERQSKIVRF